MLVKRLVPVAGCIALVGAVAALPRAQMRVVPLDDEQGHVALGLALRHLANAGIFLQATAHPDDENNGLFVMLNRGLGYRTALATATRGNGGQNEIGPEIGEPLGVLRTEELAALHRFDGAEQCFTRAVDFGYSFSIEETFEKWGKDEILGDYVRLIRMIRPDVVTAMRPDGTGGGQHHQASAVLSHEAFKLAGDPTKYPEQLNAGLRPWQPKKFYFIGRFGFPGEPPPDPNVKLVTINLATYDPLLGRTYADIGTEARSMHKCQGMAQLLALPGPATTSYQLVESTIPNQPRDEKSLFDGLDSSLGALARFAGPKPPKELAEGLSSISTAALSAQRKFDGESDAATVQPLLTGLHAVRVLRGQARGLPIDDAGRFELDFRLRQKEREFQQAVLIANGLEVEALADAGVVTPRQPIKVSVLIANHGVADVTVSQVKFDGFEGEASCALSAVAQAGGGRGGQPPAGPAISVLHKDQVAHCEPTLRIPADARVTEPYWHRRDEAGRYTVDADAPFGLPYRPTPFYVQVTFTFPGGEQVIDGLPVQHRYEGNIFSGEKRTDLLVTPVLSVRVSPEIAVFPEGALRPLPPPAAARPRATSKGAAAPPASKPVAPPSPGASREIRVTVLNDSPGPIESVVRLQLPNGWTSSPTEESIKLERKDESRTLRFDVKPTPGASVGEYRIGAVASADGQTFARGYQVIEYPHIRRQHFYHAADTTVKVIDVRAAPGLSVGYVMGVGDEVPSAIEQLGAKVEYLGADDLAWGNLSRFDAIVTGVRAYERRADLRANNGRLLQYVFNGGTLIVQYNKFEFNRAQYGPYPAKVSSDRVTDETSPVKILAPSDPVLTTPNRITDAAWTGWVQERGLYFLGERDSRYHDLVQLEDPFPYNKGAKTGALVEATYGKGRWVYVGLGLWRQLPAGTDGAYQLLANLVSLGKAGSASKPAAPLVR